MLPEALDLKSAPSQSCASSTPRAEDAAARPVHVDNSEQSRLVADQESEASAHAKLSSSWLANVGSLVRPFDARLLLRYIPLMPLESLQKLVTAWEGLGAEEKTSKMAARMALANIFERLAKDDVVFEVVHEQWQATTDKRASRKGKGATQKRTRQWHREHGAPYGLKLVVFMPRFHRVMQRQIIN